MARTSAAEVSVSDSEAEKKQNKRSRNNKSHSKKEMTAPKDAEQSETQNNTEMSESTMYSEQSEVFADIKQNEPTVETDDPFGGDEEINLNKSLEGKGKEIKYINFSELYFKDSYENYDGYDNIHPMRLLATISGVSKVSEEKAKYYKDGIQRYRVRYSVMKLYLNYKQDGKDNWKSLNVFDMVKTFQERHPNEYNYSYCLSDSFTVKEDVKETILKNNGIFTIFVKCFKSEIMETPKLIYKDVDNGIILSYPKNNPKFKQGIDYYNKLLPDFVNKYTYKIYDELTKMYMTFKAKEFEARTKEDDDFLKAIEE